MIILDTNILTKSDVQSAITDLVRTIQASGVERVAVPWVVLEELTAHRAVPYRQKYEKADAALRNLKEGTPWEIHATLPQMELQRFQDEWRKKWLDVVEVIPTSEAALRQALIREANLLPPCKKVTINEGGDTEKVGGRDAAIWLTAVEYTREHPDETVYFVSKNTQDFGKGDIYPYPMNEDLKGIEDRFVLLTNWYDVFEKFTSKAEADEARVRQILAARETTELIAEEAQRAFSVLVPLSAGHFDCTPAADLDMSAETQPDFLSPTVAEGWLVTPTAVFDSVKDVRAYSIGEHVWCTGWARWLLGGPALIPALEGGISVGCAWETRVLISTTNNEARPTLLRTRRPEAITVPELEKLPPLPPLPPRTFWPAIRGFFSGPYGSAMKTLLAAGGSPLSSDLEQRLEHLLWVRAAAEGLEERDLPLLGPVGLE
ncbi:PIN domain-containing protein [Streptomyces longwoodensis]|uniref:PIN domain-containing protein n=1 Tax=Streptomyces longwoodensis TaxID=68231 RepID=UPI003823927F